jgi:sugar/nucleoside kinase (ribokinase family)
MREAQARGVLVYVDPQWNPERLHSPAFRDALTCVDVFSPNLVEALEMTGASEAGDALDVLCQWCSCVVIKCGAQGCIARSGDTYYAVPAIPVEAVETTGAGDNFNAGLIYGLLSGYDFETCLQCANIAGGLSTLVIGGCANEVRTAVVEAWLVRQTEEKPSL